MMKKGDPTYVFTSGRWMVSTESDSKKASKLKNHKKHTKVKVIRKIFGD